MEILKNILTGMLIIAIVFIPLLILIFVAKILFGILGIILLPFAALFILICYSIGADFRN